MIIKLAFIFEPLVLSLLLAATCLLTAWSLYRWAYTAKPAMTTQVADTDADNQQRIQSDLLTSTRQAPPPLAHPSLSHDTAPQLPPSSTARSNQHPYVVDTKAEETFVHRFWQFTASCVIGKSLKHRQTLANLRLRDPEFLPVLDKWAARDLFSYVPIRTQTQMMYTEDGNLTAERPDGLPCSGQNDIIPMLCLSQQAPCAFIFHLSEKKFYTVDPSHTYHGPESSGYFTDSSGTHIQTEIQQELQNLTDHDVIDLTTFTHVELSPKTALAFTEHPVYNFLCQAMCLALSYEFEDRTLHPSPQDFGDLLANTFVNTQNSDYSRRVTLSRLEEHNQFFSESVSAQPHSKKTEPDHNNTSDPRSVTFSEIADLCYPRATN